MGERISRAKAWIAETFAPLKPVYDAWMRAIAAFSWVFVRVGLILAFVTAFLLYGIILRIVGKDPMARSFEEDWDTYWTDNTVNNDDIEDYDKLY